MQPTSKKLLAIALAGSLALAACGGDDATAPAQSGESLAVPQEGGETEPVVDPPSRASEDPTVEDPASQLRAQLTGLLADHVYLAGITFESAIDAGGDLTAPMVVTALAALDDNTVALADAIGEVATADQREAFLQLWRDHIGFFTEYALATAVGDDTEAATAVDELDAYKQEAAEFFAEVTAGELAADATVDTLDTHVDTLLDAIDAMIADDPRTIEVLQTAAEHMQETGQAIAAAIVTAMPDEFPGDALSEPADVLATVSYLLREHVYLTGLVVAEALEDTPVDPAAVAASEALENNAEGLADVVGIAADREWEVAFLDLWHTHEADLIRYAVGLSNGDQAMVDAAATRLEGFRTAMGALFDDITAEPTDAVVISQALENITVNLRDAIEGIVEGDPVANIELRDVAQQTDIAAMLLAEAVAIAAG